MRFTGSFPRTWTVSSTTQSSSHFHTRISPILITSLSAASAASTLTTTGSQTRFDADPDGTAVLQIQWGVIASRDEFVIAPKRARYEARVARAGDYPALARAMSEVLQQFSRDVAASLENAMSRSDD